MKRSILLIILLIIVFFSFLFISSVVYACEPCYKILNFEETVEKSDLIIVGQKIGEASPWSDDEEFGPEWIEVKIIEVLKGSPQNTTIKINSWDGMCNYGIIINDNRNYVILLQKRESAEENFQYDAVDFGCSQTVYSIENNQVNFFQYSKQKIPMEEFVSKLGSQTSRQIISDKFQKQTFALYYVIPMIIVLIVLIFVIIKIRKR